MKHLAYLFALLLPLAAQAQTYEEEVRAQMDREAEAWSTGDIAGIGGDSFNVGFGFRTHAPRMTREMPPEAMPAILGQFFGAMDYFRLIPGERNVIIDGDYALVWGFHTEEFRIKGQQDEKVLVRSSATMKRQPDGYWKTLLSHRDVQKFGEDGNYLQEFIE